ncbi:MAG: hypothetical protein CL933_15345 [Deltaproteobacteria bacterium]|nr:hypothetical protein [Deltaproteobacteria bacterium]
MFHSRRRLKSIRIEHFSVDTGRIGGFRGGVGVAECPAVGIPPRSRLEIGGCARSQVGPSEENRVVGLTSAASARGFAPNSRAVKWIGSPPRTDGGGASGNADNQ